MTVVYYQKLICILLFSSSAADMVACVEEIFLDKNLNRTSLADDLKQKEFDILKVGF